MKNLDKEFLVNMRAFVQRVYEYRPPVDVEAGAMPYNTCDYYAIEEYMKEIDELIKKSEKELQKRNEYKEYVSTLILWLAGIYLVVFTVCLGLLP